MSRRIGRTSNFEGKGYVYYLFRRVPEAVGAFTAATEKRPNNMRGYFSRADIYFDIGDHESSAKDYTKVIELNPA